MRAIYAFSGDPITNGHIDVVRRAARTYNEVVVAIGENPRKAGNYLFERRERLGLARRCLAGIANVRCVLFNGLLAEYAYRNGFDVIIRGVRNASDLENELVQFAINESLHPTLDTAFFPTRSSLAHISSSVVKAIVAEGGDVSAFCPLPVKEALEKKILRKFTVGVAGGIAAGKTFVAHRLVELLEAKGLRAAYMSLDQVGHYVLSDAPERTYRETRRRLAARFGTDIVMDTGAIDRRKLGRIVFADQVALDDLNRIMHEPMLAKLYEETRDLPNGVIVILEGAILVEAQATGLVNNNLVLLDAPEPVRRRRLMDRAGIGEEEAMIKIRRQVTAAARRASVQRDIERHHWGRLWELDDTSNAAAIAAIADDIASLATGPLCVVEGQTLSNGSPSAPDTPAPPA